MKLVTWITKNAEVYGAKIVARRFAIGLYETPPLFVNEIYSLDERTYLK